MEKTSIFEKSTATNRNLLALIILPLIILAIAFISYLYFSYSGDSEASEKIFNALLPMFATWVGTILAFYFGRENFEAASNRYQQIISQLTPEMLDDVEVDQIMISRKTMVAMTYSKAATQNVGQLSDFLIQVDKTRLPILEGDQIKYVVHDSTFLKAKDTDSDNPMNFSDFEKAYGNTISLYKTVPEGSILEDILILIKKNPGVKDVFIIDAAGTVKGWLTDTLIMRYMKK